MTTEVSSPGRDESVVMVTGGASGIGHASVQRLMSPVVAVVASAGIHGGEETTTATNRLIRVLGLPPRERRETPLSAYEVITPEHLRRMLDVHVNGKYVTFRATLPAMVRITGGRLLRVWSSRM